MTDARKPGSDLAEDVLGMGGRELVTVRDLLLRPATVLKAWMEGGAEGGGLYARPLRLYLALNAILMLILFLKGGAGYMLESYPPEVLAPLLEQTGKSRDAFIADADGWMTLVLVPLGSIFFALTATPFLRWWDKDHLGWRRGFRATFGWLCAWTVTMLPLAWWGYGTSPLVGVVSLIIAALGVIAFVRMGQGRWFRTRVIGVLKGIVLMAAVQLAAGVAGALVGIIGIVGAFVSP
jgi:hypothetical protein